MINRIHSRINDTSASWWTNIILPNCTMWSSNFDIYLHIHYIREVLILFIKTLHENYYSNKSFYRESPIIFILTSMLIVTLDGLFVPGRIENLRVHQSIAFRTNDRKWSPRSTCPVNVVACAGTRMGIEGVNKKGKTVWS